MLSMTHSLNFAVHCCTNGQLVNDSMEYRIRLLGRVRKLLAQPGQSLFGALASENLRKGSTRQHRTNVET
jgi:hypothetical protein